MSTLVETLLHMPEALERLGYMAHRAQETSGSVQRQNAGRGGGVAEEEKGFGVAPVDIVETPKAYTFILDVPGIPKTDIQVTLEDEKILAIKSNGKRKREDGEEEGSKYLRLERRGAAKFLRKFRLPDDANPSAISAKCENGVLTVTVEKLPPPPESKSKTVEVKVG